MASTYSALKFELIGTGEQVGSWGSTTNTNIGTAVQEAIAASADVSFASADVTLTLTDTNGTQTARHLRLNCTGTSGGARNLILGSGCQIEKPYVINNGLADAVTVKNTTGTGVAVPAGKTMWVYNNGVNVVDVITHATSLTLSTDLAIADGGTGASDAATARTNFGLGTMATQAASSVAITGGTMSGVAITGGSISGITDLAIADGGTGASTAQDARNNLLPTQTGNSSKFLTTDGTNVAWEAVDISTADVTGTLPVANGGTGATTLTANNVLLGNGTSAPQFVAPSTSGNVLTSDGTTWTSAQGFVTGMIMLWSGSIASIPSGWALCNGSSGTPDLRDRFVVGAGSTYAVDATGGSADAIVVSHTHTATSTVTDPGHIHTINNTTTLGGGLMGSGTGPSGSIVSNSATTGITVATTIASAGSSGTNANLPPYYALAYIMKT
jgi:hypothetical protein